MSDDFDDKTKIEILRRALISAVSQLADKDADKDLYPREINVRLAPPDIFDTFQREDNYLHDGLHIIFGIAEDGRVDIQAVRIDKWAYLREG